MINYMLNNLHLCSLIFTIIVVSYIFRYCVIVVVCC